jgi:hypothetical protein
VVLGRGKCKVVMYTDILITSDGSFTDLTCKSLYPTPRHTLHYFLNRTRKVN